VGGDEKRFVIRTMIDLEATPVFLIYRYCSIAQSNTTSQNNQTVVKIPLPSEPISLVKLLILRKNGPKSAKFAKIR
jgi:hypothetical protein